MVDSALRAFVAELGATEHQLAGLDDVDDLIGLAGDLQLAEGLDRTLDDLARETGCGVDEVRSIYERLGLRPEELAGFGEADLALVSLVTGDASGIVDEVAPQLLRVAGSLLARLAEATIAAYVQDVESGDDDSSDLIALASRNALASTLVVTLGDNLAPVFRHHMWTAVRRQRDAQVGVASKEIVRIAIGFVDLVGFTSRSRTLAPAELIAMIEDFEQRAFETATRHGGRIVKSIGDEVMIAAGNVGAVAEIALELIAGTNDDPSIAPRGGVSAGDVLFRLGDYYGPVVNLASRLTTEAVPGEVLTDVPTLDADHLALRAAGRRMLKGLAEPVEVWTIVSVG
jgi:adenylate cyclase